MITEWIVQHAKGFFQPHNKGKFDIHQYAPALYLKGFNDISRLNYPAMTDDMTLQRLGYQMTDFNEWDR